jgi:hypothetical protein
MEALTKRLTNMRGITAWMFIAGCIGISYVHKDVAGAVMASGAAVAIAFIGGSVAADYMQGSKQ